MMKIRKNDDVQVISGNYKGKTGRVLQIIKEKNRILVEGINLAKKHMRPSQENQQGGIIEKELSINISNVMLLKKGTPVKVGFKILKDVEMLEIKQGPYNLIKDKVKFDNISDKKIKLRK